MNNGSRTSAELTENTELGHIQADYWEVPRDQH